MFFHIKRKRGSHHQLNGCRIACHVNTFSLHSHNRFSAFQRKANLKELANKNHTYIWVTISCSLFFFYKCLLYSNNFDKVLICDYIFIWVNGNHNQLILFLYNNLSTTMYSVSFERNEKLFTWHVQSYWAGYFNYNLIIAIHKIKP